MADAKLTALSELSVPSLEDLLYTVDDPAGTPAQAKLSAQRFLGQGGFVPGGRLTLVTGQPLYAPEQTLTPSATSTANDTVDFAAAHGWVTGTAVTVSATAGGLTIHTTYYINATDADTVSFHTTVALAIAGTSKVDLTATITATITAIGVGSSTLRYPPFINNRIRVFDGTRWVYKVFAECTLALTLTAGKAYDVFIDDDVSTLSLSTAWTTTTARADALGDQDGVAVLGSDHTKLHLGTLYAPATDTAVDHEWQRLVENRYNQVPRRIFKDLAGSGTYNSATIQQWFASAASQIELICGVRGKSFLLGVTAQLTADALSTPRIGIGDNSTTTFMLGSFFDIATTVATVRGLGATSITPRLGYSAISMNQADGTGAGTATFGSGRIFGSILT